MSKNQKKEKTDGSKRLRMQRECKRKKMEMIATWVILACLLFSIQVLCSNLNKVRILDDGFFREKGTKQLFLIPFLFFRTTVS